MTPGGFGQTLKILYLTRGGYLYGAQRQLLCLLEGLDRSRFEPLVLCTEEGPFLGEIEKLHIRWRLWKCAGWRKVKPIFDSDLSYPQPESLFLGQERGIL